MLRDIDLTVRPGEVLGISGPSGSGKTTLLHLIAGLEDPDQGSVRLSGVTLTDEDDPGAGVRELGAFLYEPDGAVIRAGLVTAVAALADGGLLDQHIAYVTGDERIRTPFARGYEVLERLPYREKPLRAALRARGVGSLTIKKRGVDVVPDQLRKRLDLSGDAEATIVLTRAAGSGIALLVAPF